MFECLLTDGVKARIVAINSAAIRALSPKQTTCRDKPQVIKADRDISDLTSRNSRSEAEIGLRLML